MDALKGLLLGVAVVAIACGALAMIVGLGPMRDRFLQLGAGLVFASLVISLLEGATGAIRHDLPAGVDAVPSMLAGAVGVAVIFGHIVLAVALVRRRLRGRDAARAQRDAHERARLRTRPRLLPGGEEP